MAAFSSKTKEFLQAVGTAAKHWTKDYSPGEIVPVSGIYRCKVCGKEITSNEDDPFPPQNHHQHSFDLKILWQLIVRTDTNGDRFGLK